MECPECGAVFFAASASSMEDVDGTIIGGVECPECGAFIDDETLAQQAEEDES